MSFFFKIINAVNVPETLTHLLSGNKHKSSMYPIVHKFLPCCRFRLSDFICVMDGHMIKSTRMNIKCLTKILHTHRRTLDMPTRESFPPRTLPFHLTFSLS